MDTKETSTSKTAEDETEVPTLTVESSVENSSQEKSEAAVEKKNEPPKPSEKKPSATSTPKNSKPWGIIGALLVLFILVAATASLSVYQWLNGGPQTSEFAVSLQAFEQQSLAREVASKNLMVEVASLERQQQSLEDQQKARYSQLEEKLIEQQQRMLAMTSTDRDDWLLAEVEYLLRLANQRLALGKQVEGALALLTAADEIVREMDGTLMRDVRQAIADDAVALRTVESVDVEGIYFSLEAAAKNIAQIRLLSLPAAQGIEEGEGVEAEQPQQTITQKIKNGFAQAWQSVSQYITIKRHNEIYQPDLSPDAEFALRQSVQLMFEQAEMALLAEEQVLYQRSLSKIEQWLNTYYRLDENAQAAALELIAELKAKKVTSELPDISGSLKAFKKYLQMRHPVEVNENESNSSSANGSAQ